LYTALFGVLQSRSSVQFWNWKTKGTFRICLLPPSRISFVFLFVPRIRCTFRNIFIRNVYQ
jgi:hypothetical protein